MMKPPKNKGDEAFFQEEKKGKHSFFRSYQEIPPKEWRDLIILVGHPDDHY